MNIKSMVCAALLSAVLPGPGWAEPQPAPVYQMVLAPGTAKAINYRDLAGATVIGFRGTVLAPQATGKAKVVAQSGAKRIRARFEQLKPAASFGPGYLTYVLWAVTPVGHPVNLGEVVVSRRGKAAIEAHTNLQTFGLIVSAEPHFAVTQVSSLVVLENEVTRDTRGQVEEVEAHYELMPTPAPLPEPMLPPPDPRFSPYVLQAYNAMTIARAARADQDAPQEFQKAAQLLDQLQQEPKKWKKPAIRLARQLVQQAEDARMVAVKNQEEARLEQEHQAVETSRLEAQAAKAETEAARATARAEAEASRAAAEAAKAAAQQATRKAREQVSREVSAEKLALRRKLREQLDRLLETRETERGLVVSMSDLLFPSGKAILQAPTREKLAKITGILMAYPGLHVAVEGHTDSTGPESFNQKLSERRAHAVRAFKIRQGLHPDAVTACGFGSTRPVASNEIPSGRQLNRRVDLILTGDPIGF